MPGVIALAPIYLATDPTFTVYTGAVTLAANQFIIAIQNTLATHVIEIHKIKILNRQLSGTVVGVFAEYHLKRGTGITAGTALSAKSYDTTKPLPAGINIFRTPTAIGTEETDPLDKWIWSSDETSPNDASKVAGSNLAFQTIFNLLDEYPPFGKPVLNQNQVLAIKQVTPAPAGQSEIMIGFTAVRIT